MYDIVDYGCMIAFQERTSAYARALKANIAPGAVVLDIGAGPGILSFLACQAGAAKVYAVESEDVIQLAREIALDNGFADRIEFIQAVTTEINLPQKVDGVVSEIHGGLPLYGKNVLSILDARVRFLKPEGWIVPARDIIWAALTYSAELHSKFNDVWDTEYRFDFEKARTRGVNSFCSTRVKVADLVTTPERWAVLDYRQLGDPSVTGSVSWSIDRRVTAHGISMWFDCETSGGFAFSNSPWVTEPYVYRHAFFPWPKAVNVMAGDQVKVDVRADFVDSDYVWSWNTLVTNESGEVKTRYRQSTFIGEPLSPTRLRKRAAINVPDPNEEWRIDYRALELMRSNMSLGEIAQVLLSEFPAFFKDWQAALTRVADLSEKYSK